MYFSGLVFYFTTPFSVYLQRRIQNPVEHLQQSFFAKILNGYELLTIFAKKLHRRCLTGLKICFWLLAKGLNRENTLPENVCDFVFEKMKGRGGTERVFTKKQPSEGFFKRCCQKFRGICKKTYAREKPNSSAGIFL